MNKPTKPARRTPKAADPAPKKKQPRTAQVAGPQPGFPIMHNITERKQAEKELRNSEERFRRVFDDGPLGMAVTNKQYHFVQVNAMFCQMLGYTEQELIKLTFKDITHPDDMGDSIKKVHELEKGNISVYKTEKRYITKNKDIIWGSLTLSMILDKDEEFQFYLVMIEDITERKRVEQALAESEIKFRWLYEYAPSAYHLLTPDGTLMDVNRRWCDLLGYRREEVLGKAIFDFV
ncbi:MAG: PAS domain S-box protein, partial [Chloroflexi bacterium]|nr:PAS domain S-box protein [Chloroflexota bacterium]